MLLRAGSLIADIYLTFHTPVHLKFSPTPLMAVGSETRRFLLVPRAGRHFVAVIVNRYPGGEDVDTTPISTSFGPISGEGRPYKSITGKSVSNVYTNRSIWLATEVALWAADCEEYVIALDIPINANVARRISVLFNR